MPELPEVETISQGLKHYLIGQTFVAVTTDTAKLFPNDPFLVETNLLGACVKTVKRRGKALIIELSSGYFLVIHLKMTGQLIYVNAQTKPRIDETLPGRFTHVIFRLADGSRLYYNDQRKFGWIKLLSKSQLAELPLIKKMGPEPLTNKFTADYLQQRLIKRSGSCIKAALLDQTLVAGIGNIYADESLFLAGINPKRTAGSLELIEVKRLHRQIRAVLRQSIAVGGSSRQSYVNVIGQKGDYLTTAYVYNRQNEPCLNCGQPIGKMRVAGRGTHYCPRCQK